MTDLDTLPATPEPGAIDLWSRGDERAVINLVPPPVQAAFLDAAAKKPDLFGKDESALFKALRADNLTPSATDNRMRLQFWLEYDQAQASGKKMRMEQVFGGLCSKQYFYGRFIACPEKLAWLLTPPVHYVNKITEALDYSIDRLRDFLEEDPAAYGKNKLKAVELQLKIYLMLDQRKHGAFTQKIEQKNMNLNVATTDKQVAQALAGESMEELDRRIKDLERRERAALNLPESNEPIEVEGTPISEPG